MVAPAGQEPLPDGPSGTGLAAALRERTRLLHCRAERSGVMRDLLRGRIDPRRYLRLLESLLPVYRALEDGLRRHLELPSLAPFAHPGILRAERLAEDAATLAGRLGPGGGALPAGLDYARRIEEVAGSQPERLLAHAYVRHMGDLSGGQIVRRILSQTTGIGPDAVRLYEFPEFSDLEQAKAEYRASLDRAEAHLADREGVLEEACEAFRLSIALLLSVRGAADDRSD